MEKKRATHHSKRVATKKHNDRNYDFANAKNINEKLTDYNLYYNYYQGYYTHKQKENDEKIISYEEVENRFYEENFKQQWINTNKKYVEQRHEEHCKSWDDWKSLNKNLCEEIHLQIGNKDNNIDAKTFLNVFKSYSKKLSELNKKLGNVYTILDQSAHFDEAVPHSQIRRVWHYRNDENVLCIGQEEALKRAGVPLPNPKKKKGRYNNRKQTFDKMCREMYLESCAEFGLDIETVPLLDVRHNMSKEEFLDTKIANKQQEISDKEQILQDKEHSLQTSEQNIKEAVRDIENKAVDFYNKSKNLYASLCRESEDFKSNKAQLYNKSLQRAEQAQIKLNESLLTISSNKQKERDFSL